MPPLPHPPFLLTSAFPHQQALMVPVLEKLNLVNFQKIYCKNIARKQLHALVLDQLLQEPSCTHLVMSTPISLFHVLILTLSRITATQSLFLPSIYEFDHSWQPVVPASLNVSGVSAVAVCPDDECAEVMYIALPLQAVQRSRILFLK